VLRPARACTSSAVADSVQPLGQDRLHDRAKSDASDPFIICREDEDPDVLWCIEVFKSDEAKDAYENGPMADELRDEILDVLAEPPMRIPVHPYSAS
jgi:hypothetical protein